MRSYRTRPKVLVVAVLAGAATLVVGGSSGWRWMVAELMVPAGFLVAVAVLIVRDSAARGRSGGKWLAACAFLAPIAVPAFLVVAAVDRLRGRRGIEARWTPGGRWFLLGGVVLAIAAGAVAISQVNVPGMSVSTPMASGSFSGQCSSALAVSLGAGSYDQLSPGRSSGPPVPPILVSAQATVAGRCAAAAASRMTASAACLAAAWLLALVGERMSRRRYRPRSGLQAGVTT
jgi:hypothetical protein